MAYLQYYQQERKEFPEAENQELSSKEIQIVAKKLSRHYKLGNVDVEFTSGRNNSKGSRWRIRINMDNMNNFLVVCHEMAHVYQLRKLNFKSGDRWHGKEHHKIMKRMINYCAKRNWFKEELERRTTFKAPKPEPSKDEVRAKELIKLQEKIVRYEKKILFYTKKMRKAKRSYTMKSLWLNRRQSNDKNNN